MYIASYYSKAGKHMFSTSAYKTREGAARTLFILCRKAKRCSTAIATLIDDKWQQFGMDIQWHDRGDFCI